MSYGLKYIGEFDSVVNERYRVEIYQKNYSGAFYSITLSSPACTLSSNSDDPKASIKGQSLEIRIVNEDGTLPIANFYSDDDTGFLVKFYWVDSGVNKLQFTGFINQDDCSEIIIDYTHELVLTANDGLALLKNVPFNITGTDQNGDRGNYSVPVPYESASFVYTAPHTIEINNTNFIPKTGDIFYIQNGSTSSPFLATSVTGNIITVSPTIATSSFDGFIYQIKDFDYAGKNPIALIIMICLRNTGLDLGSVFGFNIYEIYHKQGQNPLYQTYLDCSIFLNDDGSYKNCYDVLTTCLLNTLTVFQANGVWAIIRWDEARYTGTNRTGFTYGSDFIFKSKGNLFNNQLVGFDLGLSQDFKPETGMLKIINRPFQYVKRTFNYNQPTDLAKNLRLDQTGALLNRFTTGTGVDLTTTSEYEALFINQGFKYKSADGAFADPWTKVPIIIPYFIRVVADYLGREIERYLVVKGVSHSSVDPFYDIQAAYFGPIELTEGDTIQWGFSVRLANTNTGDSSPTTVDLLSFHDGDDTKPREDFLQNEDDGKHTKWGDTILLSFPWTGAKTDWNSASFPESIPSPKDGNLYLFVGQLGVSGTEATRETHYKDFSIIVNHFVNKSLKITGQYHKDSQTNAIKQNEDIQIEADDSPSNSISGTIFRSFIDVESRITERTSVWNREGKTENKRLNEILTFEQLFYKRVPRIRLDGSVYGLISGDTHISLFSLIYPLDISPESVTTFGLLSIDYKNNSFKGTLYELFKTSESGHDELLEDTYTFTYIYSTT